MADMKCDEVRNRLESGNDDFRMRGHLRACASCSEYAALRQWSVQVVAAGQLEAVPPLMSEVWASIHRATAQAWDSALTRSFRRLLPYMVAVAALLVLVGVLQPLRAGVNGAPAPEPVNVLAGMENPPVAAVLNSALSPATSADLLGVAQQNH